MDEFRKIIEKAYLVTINEQSLNKENKNNLQIKLRTVEDGSFLGSIDLGIVGTAVQLFQQVDPETMLSIIKGAFEFLKLRNDSAKKGLPMTINNSENGTVVVVTGNNNSITIPEKSIELARKSQNNFSKMANLTSDNGDVDSISIEDENTTSESLILFNKETKDNFKVSSILEEEPMKITGRITVANEKTGTGKITIEECSEMATGEYPFELIDKESSIFREKSFKDKVVFTVLRKIKYDPATDSKEVESLKLIS